MVNTIDKTKLVDNNGLSDIKKHVNICFIHGYSSNFEKKRFRRVPKSQINELRYVNLKPYQDSVTKVLGN